MNIILTHTSMIPIYEQLVDQIKNRILSGELPADTNLPSVRALAAELKISALTVKKAYDRLEEEGFILTVHGKGSYVAPTDSQLALEVRRKQVEEIFQEAIQKARSVGMEDSEIRETVELLLEELT